MGQKDFKDIDNRSIKKQALCKLPHHLNSKQSQIALSIGESEYLCAQHQE
jgi:hypothetical protein